VKKFRDERKRTNKKGKERREIQRKLNKKQIGKIWGK
jgi:hypothetical protein